MRRDVKNLRGRLGKALNGGTQTYVRARVCVRGERDPKTEEVLEMNTVPSVENSS